MPTGVRPPPPWPADDLEFVREARKHFERCRRAEEIAHRIAAQVVLALVTGGVMWIWSLFRAPGLPWTTGGGF